MRREIDEEQAKWVKQIFEWYAEGKSPRQIASALNQRGIPSPGATYRRKDRSARYGTWSSSALRGELTGATGILANPLYIGKLIWNRREWVRNPETKSKVPRLRPQCDWIVTEQPELRIIPQTLWEKVEARRKDAALGRLDKHRPRSPKFLLSSLAQMRRLRGQFCDCGYLPICLRRA